VAGIKGFMFLELANFSMKLRIFATFQCRIGCVVNPSTFELAVQRINFKPENNTNKKEKRNLYDELLFNIN
jgi:hypothetical protein